MISTKFQPLLLYQLADMESTPQAIQRDLERCSLAMGVSPEALRRDSNTLRNISERASLFLGAMWTAIPATFYAEYKNPCWKPSAEVDRLVRHVQLHRRNGNKNITKNQAVSTLCLPYFFLAGFPKCGTTTLHHTVFEQHPDIVKPTYKEPHWWTRRKTKLSDVDDVYCYLKMFYNATQHIITKKSDYVTYDGSQSTLWDSYFIVNHQDYCATPAIMSTVLPDTKFIVVMRNPIERLYSHYFQGCTRKNSKGFGHDTSTWPKEVQENPATHFHNILVSDLEYFNGCLRERSLFECVSENRFRGDECGGVGYRITVSMYYVHLLKWLQFYRREQFLFLRTEDMSAEPEAFMNRITEFLGISPVPADSANKWLSARNNVQRLEGLDPWIDLTMRKDSKELLENFYRPYNAKLAELIGDRKFLWDD